MRWLVEELAEAALGPWALALGAGVALVMLARRRDARPGWWRQRYAAADAPRPAARGVRGAASARRAPPRDARGRFVAGSAL